jgi:cytoplasmic iron level regulating protein YaaA (DUF328/UPF0246 family)
MIFILSPSKTQNFDDELSFSEHSQPALLKESKALVSVLKKCSVKDLEKTLSISPKLAALNHERYSKFRTPFTPKNARQAILAFRGDVYQGFELDQYKKGDYSFAQKHLRILSGLYGALRPLDLIQPYRLEMKTPLKTGRGKSLYEFWGEQIQLALLEALPKKKGRFLINLASNEYSKAALLSSLEINVVTPVFKEKKGEDFKVVALFAKRARGTMSNWIIRNRITDPALLKEFKEDGYRFQKKLSNEGELVFTRG